MRDDKGMFVRGEHERLGSVDTVQTVLQDGSIDFVGRKALGGPLHQMPEGYFRSVQFVGTVAVSLDASWWEDKRLMVTGCVLCEYLSLLGLGFACQDSVSLRSAFDMTVLMFSRSLINEDIGPSPNISWVSTV